MKAYEIALMNSKSNRVIDIVGRICPSDAGIKVENQICQKYKCGRVPIVMCCYCWKQEAITADK